MNEQDARLEPALSEEVFQPLQIRLRDRHEHRIKDSRRRAFELPHLRAQVARQRYRQVGAGRAEASGEQPLMRGIDVGIQQADSHGFSANFVEPRDQRREDCFVERYLHGAIAAHAFWHSETPVAWDEGRKRIWREGINVAPDVAINLKDVFEAFGCEQRALCELAFQNRIGGHCCAVKEQPDIGERKSEALGRFAHAVHQADRWITSRCRGLPGINRAAAFVEDMQVGERAADVNGDANGGTTVENAHALTLIKSAQLQRVAKAGRGLARSTCL